MGCVRLLGAGGCGGIVVRMRRGRASIVWRCALLVQVGAFPTCYIETQQVFVHGMRLTIESKTTEEIRGDRRMRQSRCVMMGVTAAGIICLG